mmetsp:Transcript_31244/g.44369  ORF Transcript_31244/g.44369 Transcript_31244/m.44369 type:complete len:248 (+) Transcript_31244:170-913(+)
MSGRDPELAWFDASFARFACFALPSIFNAGLLCLVVSSPKLSALGGRALAGVNGLLDFELEIGSFFGRRFWGVSSASILLLLFLALMVRRCMNSVLCSTMESIPLGLATRDRTSSLSRSLSKASRSASFQIFRADVSCSSLVTYLPCICFRKRSSLRSVELPAFLVINLSLLHFFSSNSDNDALSILISESKEIILLFASCLALSRSTSAWTASSLTSLAFKALQEDVASLDEIETHSSVLEMPVKL